MTLFRPLIVICVTALCLCATWSIRVRAAGESATPGDVMLLRVFLKDGSAVVSYGEYARIGDEVVVSMPLGRDLNRPTLQLITLPAGSVDWPRTDQYAASARYQHYINTRAEADFALVSAETAGALNEIEASTDPQRAIDIADAARQRLAAWPSEHYGYRAEDVADVISVIDDAISRIAGAGSGRRPFQVSLVANPAIESVDPIVGQPLPREQVRQLAALANASPRSTDRIDLMRSALRLMDDPSSGIDREDSADLRRSLEDRIRDEMATDDAYARMATRLLSVAQRSATRAQVIDVQRVIESVSEEDARLGSRRPETANALRAELRATLDAARDLRLRRDQWTLRRGIYRNYVESISTTVAQLVKAQGSLEAIRSLAGPTPLRLQSLQRSLAGGIDRLRQIVPPDQLRATHDQLLAAWQFAVSATDARLQAVDTGDLQIAWQASSAAAGSLLLLNRAQDEMRQALAPPTLK